MASSRLVCLLVALLVSSQSSVGDDDVRFPPESKIVGGGEVDIKDFPYQVYLSTSSSACGGVIISDRWVLTAAHCTVGVDYSSITIRAGSNDRNTGGDLYGVEQVVIHPQYLRSSDYDICAMRTSKVIQFNGALGVGKVLLPPELGAEPPSEKTTVNITGWGREDPNIPDKIPDKLKGAVNSVVNFSHCSTICNSRSDRLSLCLEPETGGLYFGDSGGPTTRNNVLFGINSAITDLTGTGHGIVVSVVAFRGWIKNITDV